MFRQSLFIASIIGLVVVMSCKGKIDGSVGPSYEPDIVDPDPLVIDSDTTQLTAPNINIVEGSMTNQAASDFSSSLTNPTTKEDSTSLANTTSALDAALTTSQKTYWSNIADEAEIESAINNDDATMKTQVAALKATLEANPDLAKYVPAVTSPSGGRLIEGLRLIEAFLLNADDASRTSNDLCIQIWVDWYNAQKDIYDGNYESALATILTAFERAINTLSNSKDAQDQRFAAAFQAGVDAWKKVYTDANGNINSAMANNLLSSSNGAIATNMNKMVLALNLYYNKEVYEANQQEVLDAYNSAVASVTGTNNTLNSNAKKSYDAAIAKIKATRDENVANCHDQGGTHQGTNG